jgi:hypothetical protein
LGVRQNGRGPQRGRGARLGGARLGGALLGVAVLVSGCDDTFLSISSDGRLEISITTSGDGSDQDGFTIVVDGGAPARVGPDGTVTLTGLTRGSHQVQLTGLADACRVDGANPRTVEVGGDGRAAVQFAVVCDGSGGRRSERALVPAHWLVP